MSARDDTLRAVREALNTPPRDAATIRAEAAALLGEPQAIRPALAQGSLADVFAARVTTPKVAATVDRVAGAIDLPDAVTATCASADLRRRWRCSRRRR